MKTVVKTLARNFSDVKKSAERARSQSTSESDEIEATTTTNEYSSALNEKVVGLKHEVASLQSDLSKVIQLLRQLLIASTDIEKKVQPPDMAMTSTAKT